MSSLLSKNLKRFKLITFDVTDTLIKFRKSPALQYIETASAYGVTTVARDKAELAFKKHFKQLGKEYPNFGCNSSIDCFEWWRRLVVNVLNDASSQILDQKVVNKIAKTLIKQYETPLCWEKFSKVDDLLQEIKNANKCIGIISNFDLRLKYVIQNMGFSQFDFVLTSYEAGVSKPEKEIFDTALKKCKLNPLPSEALHIGNQMHVDYKGAKNAGWSSILVHYQKTEGENCLSYPTLSSLLLDLETKEIKL